ncbi:MAG TPA: hypothetical protein VGO27_20140 [Candidatus Acidoferrum sp.]|jgi:hypothetical protein|nr:hypothetical protein [Candidatus Acidoferrum sp.]
MDRHADRTAELAHSQAFWPFKVSVPALENGVNQMRKLLGLEWILPALLVMAGQVWSQPGQQNGVLVVSGQPGQVPVLQMSGNSYVNEKRWQD